MYDSRTIKPVLGNGSHHYGGATNRYLREPGRGKEIGYGTTAKRIHAMRPGAVLDITEGLDEYEADRAEEWGGYVRECTEEIIPGYEGLYTGTDAAEWLKSLIGELKYAIPAVWVDHRDPWTTCRSCGYEKRRSAQCGLPCV